MKTLTWIFLPVLLLLFVSCGATKHEAIMASANGYFSAKMKGDFDRMYEYMNPASREKISIENFKDQQKTYSPAGVNDFSIKGITFENPEKAMVEVIFLMDNGSFSTQFPFVLEGGSWYRYYPTYQTDK